MREFWVFTLVESFRYSSGKLAVHSKYHAPHLVLMMSRFTFYKTRLKKAEALCLKQVRARTVHLKALKKIIYDC